MSELSNHHLDIKYTVLYILEYKIIIRGFWPFHQNKCTIWSTKVWINQWWGSIYFKILINISWGLDSILILKKHFCSNKNYLKLSFYSWERHMNRYLKRYGQRSVFTTDSCLYLVKYSLKILKKKIKVLDIVNTDKNVL